MNSFLGKIAGNINNTLVGGNNQTVNKDQHRGLWRVLNKFYIETGVPILLNTSLNIKGQPLLNDENDIEKWQKTYNNLVIR